MGGRRIGPDYKKGVLYWSIRTPAVGTRVGGVLFKANQSCSKNES